MFGQQQLPDSPKPQIEGVGPITPGKGTPKTLPSSSEPEAPPSNLAPGKGTSAAQPQQTQDTFQTTAPELSPVPEPGGKTFTLPRVQVNFIEVPFMVKDKHGVQVAGLDWRDIQVYENGVRQHISFWSPGDPAPLSVAFVLDQSLPYNTMESVNASLAALQGAFAPWDEIALVTYNNGPQVRTTFTGAQSARISAVVERSKTSGRDATPMYGGPMAQTTMINGRQFDPNTAPVRNSNSTFQTIPKEVHTLNDAIMQAAQILHDRAQGRRRIIYVVSDGKEQGSKAKFKDVVKYMQTNNIAVYGTLVGDSATPGLGWLDRFHIPFQMRDNLLPQYVAATGGQLASGYRQRAIEESFQKIAMEARSQYTVGYYSHANQLDPSFRTIEVRVLRPGLDIIAKKGYYPTPSAVNHPVAPAAKSAQ